MLKDQRELLELFRAFGVEYVLIGAHAVGAYTEPRSTKDIDLLIRDTPENAERVYRALAAFGAPMSQYQPSDFCGNPGNIIQFGVPPARIDILQALEGVTAEEAWQRRVKDFDLDGTMIDIISVEDLINNKRAVGRFQDLADVEKLERYK